MHACQAGEQFIHSKCTVEGQACREVRAHLDLEQVAGDAVAGHGLGERALRGEAGGGAAAELGEEVVRQRGSRRALCFDGVHRERVRHQLDQRGAVAGD